ncbi:CHASE2 domain-containing protein [Methylomonas sp. MgM2]
MNIKHQNSFDQIKTKIRRFIYLSVSASALSVLSILLLHGSDFILTNDSAANYLADVEMRYINDYDPANLDNISLLLISDHDLDQLGLSWPPSLDWYLQMLTEVACRKPRAILVDLTIDRLSHESTLEGNNMETSRFRNKLVEISEGRQICPNNVKPQKTKIYLPDPNYRDQKNAGVIGNVDTKLEIGNTQRRYDQEYPYDMNGVFSLAYGAFRDICIFASPDRKYSCNGNGYFVVNWSTKYSDRRNIQVMENPCDAIDSSEKSFILRTLGKFAVYNEIYGDRATLKCFPFVYSYLSRLMKTPSQQDNVILNALIYNKYVFIGGHGIASNDYIETPLHTIRFPGVIFHAMALENLLTQNENTRSLIPEKLYKIFLFFGYFIGYLFVFLTNSTMHNYKHIAAYIPSILVSMLSIIFYFISVKLNWFGAISVIAPVLGNVFSLNFVSMYLNHLWKIQRKM